MDSILHTLRIPKSDFEGQSTATKRLLLLDGVTMRSRSSSPASCAASRASVGGGRTTSTAAKRSASQHSDDGPHEMIDALDLDDNGNSDEVMELMQMEAQRRYDLLMKRGRLLLQQYRNHA